MRRIDSIVIHGSWTKPGVDIGVEEIRRWHTDPKEEGGRGWSDIGYHYVVRRDGTVEEGRPAEKQGAHVGGHNKHTLGICLVGGREDETPDTAGLPEEAKQELLWEFNYTERQIRALVQLVTKLQLRHDVEEVLGHRDYPGVTKRCPGFDAATFFRM